MAKQKRSRAFAVYIGILTALLLCAIAMLAYALSTNGVREIRIPGGIRMAEAGPC